MTTWLTPEGTVNRLYADMLNQTHLLIAGMTGAGKSTVVQGIIHTALFDSPAVNQFILIDPKKVALIKYKSLPHTIAYACENDTMIAALEKAVEIMNERYNVMQAQEIEDYEGTHIYVIIDELAHLMLNVKKQAAPLIQSLAQLGRAARIHVIAATQHPLTDVIPTCIKVNFDAKVGLRTECAQHSRNIIHETGCELLPKFGKCWYVTPKYHSIQTVTRIPDEERLAIIAYWKSDECIVKPAKAQPKRRGFLAALFG